MHSSAGLYVLHILPNLQIYDINNHTRLPVAQIHNRCKDIQKIERYKETLAYRSTKDVILLYSYNLRIRLVDFPGKNRNRHDTVRHNCSQIIYGSNDECHHHLPIYNARLIF